MGSEPVGERASDRSPEIAINRARSEPPDALSHRLAPATKENEIKVLVDGNHLSVSAVVDRQGLKKLMKILEANSALLEESKRD